MDNSSVTPLSSPRYFAITGPNEGPPCTLSHFFSEFISQSSDHPGRRTSPLLGRIAFIPSDPSEVSLLDAAEESSLTLQILTSVNDATELSDQERGLCIKLIKQYLYSPGYVRYQAFCHAILLKAPVTLDLNKVKGMTETLADKVDQIKVNNEAILFRFKNILPFARQEALFLHHRLLKEVQGEPPQFNSETEEIACSFDQFEFALVEGQKRLGSLISQAQTSQNALAKCFITRVFQIILCGDLFLDRPYLTNSVCFLIRESLGKSLPALAIDRALDSCRHLVVREFPLRTENFSLSLEGGTCQLCVSWETPRRLLEDLVSYLVAPHLKPHVFTHPLTGPHLDAFANKCVKRFDLLLRSCLNNKNNTKSIALLQPSELIAFERTIKVALRTLTGAKTDLCSQFPQDFRSEMAEFFREFFEIFTSAVSVVEFQEKMRELAKNKEFQQEFLEQILAFIETNNAGLLLTLANYHQRYRRSYETSVLPALGIYKSLQMAFSHEEAPIINETTGQITVSYERFRLALILFNHSAKWMTRFASSRMEIGLANHILSLIICGNVAQPLLNSQSQNPHCFLIREFDHADPCISQQVRAESHGREVTGISIAQHLFNEIERLDEGLGEEEQFKASLSKVGSLFVFDAITRNNYQVRIGNQILMTRDVHFFPFILQNYIVYLEQNPLEAEFIRNTPFYQIFSRNFDLESFWHNLPNQNNSDLIVHFKDELFRFLRNVPQDFRNLVYLKMIELMCIFNQTLFLSTSSTMNGSVNQFLAEQDFPIVMFGSEYEYGFSLETPRLDALTCEGRIISFLTGGCSNKIFEMIFPAQFDLAYNLPSLCQWEADKVPPCPRMKVVALRFNALCPVRFLECMGMGINRGLVQNVHSEWELLQILENLEQLQKKIASMGEMLLALEEIPLDEIVNIEKLFYDAFKIKNKLALLSQIFSTQKEEIKKIAQSQTQLGTILITLQKISQKLGKQDPSSPPLKRLKTKITGWFPGIRFF